MIAALEGGPLNGQEREVLAGRTLRVVLPNTDDHVERVARYRPHPIRSWVYTFHGIETAHRFKRIQPPVPIAP